MGLWLIIVSCDCGNYRKNGLRKGEQLPNPTSAHLLLSSDKSNLEDNQTSFCIFIRNEQETVANLHEYYMKISLQEDGGEGSTLEYTIDTTTHRLQPALFSQQPLSQIFKQETLKKGGSPLCISFQLQPLPSVKKITMILLLEHQHSKDQVTPIAVSWSRITSITDPMIQLAKEKGYTFLAEVLTQLKKGEVVGINRVNNKTTDKPTPLHEAAQLGDITIFNALLERGAEIDARDSYDDTPLHHTIYWEYLPIVRKLIEKGANLNSKAVDGETPLYMAMFNHPTNKEIIDALLEKQDLSQVKEKDDQDNTILVGAIQSGFTDLALALMANSTKAQLNNRFDGV